MNKNLFKRVICLVIALMMIMPNMPMNLVRAEEEILTNLEEPSVESPLGEEPPAEEPPAEEPPAEEPPLEEP
ncbi:MAG TPA: IS5 family transposase, partial [Sedimentibacter sp.]|nr:IS5 family transposase [Sedimentibacter sp.]